MLLLDKYGVKKNLNSITKMLKNVTWTCFKYFSQYPCENTSSCPYRCSIKKYGCGILEKEENIPDTYVKIYPISWKIPRISSKATPPDMKEVLKVLSNMDLEDKIKLGILGEKQPDKS